MGHVGEGSVLFALERRGTGGVVGPALGRLGLEKLCPRRL